MDVSRSASTGEEVGNKSCVMLWCKEEWVRKRCCVVVLDQEVYFGMVGANDELVADGGIHVGLCGGWDESRCF